MFEINLLFENGKIDQFGYCFDFFSSQNLVIFLFFLKHEEERRRNSDCLLFNLEDYF